MDLLMIILCLVVCMSSTEDSGSNSTESEVSSSAYITASTIAPYVNETQDVDSENLDVYPYRVCMALSTDLVRFANNIQCVSHSPKTPVNEGIMIVYKQNIVAHTFKVITYYKDVIFQRSYADTTTNYLLGTSVTKMVMPPWEIEEVNKRTRCYSAVSKVINGIELVAYHEDGYRNYTMLLIPDDYSSKSSMRYVTTKSLYHKGASTWLYTESCNINCVVTITKARSNSPYDFFVLSSGEVVEISPFYDGENKETFEENTDMFWIMTNYSMKEYFGEMTAPKRIVPKMAFLQRPEMTIAWEIHKKENVTCAWKKWQTVSRAIRTEQNTSFHFVSKSLTATFVSQKTKYNYSMINEELGYNPFTCVVDEFTKEIETVYNNEYNETHDRDGEIEMYVTTGGLVVLWQSLVPKSLNNLVKFAAVNNVSIETNSTRRRRSVDDVVTDITYAQLQFTYDTLREYINQALRSIMDAWCHDQKRTAEMLRELSKINPSNILSAIYEKPMTARLAGDVIALSKCIEVNQDSVKVMKDMRIIEGGKVVNCYSRPLVVFQFVNSSKLESGQLGENNEILLGTFRTENCDRNSRKIFLAGNLAYEYRDYIFKNVTDLKTIDIIDTMIKLDIEPLENTDFNILELYSKGELKASNVFNLEDIMREYNSQKQHIRYLTSQVNDRIPSYLHGLDQFMQGLGVAGHGLGVALGAVGGAVTSVVSAIGSFFSNPFGAFTGILIVVGVLLVIYVIFTRQRSAAQRPVDYFFPYATQTAVTTVSTSSDKTSPYDDYSKSFKSNVTQSDDDVGDIGKKKPKTYSEDDALQILRALKRLDENQRSVAKKPVKTHRSIIDKLKNSGYKRLPESDTEDFE
nr:envelope glycoprotein B [Mastomys natalensis cytomegalovirus 3]WEG70031.1 envelope glycoprotein B [Mastomys natalensis cytomegalovirus 3]WEG70171.1 envelope glycoprotein B [Mastomys natalensis cytomegalovirus 3]WEG70731.1 envelope glycoprotein B [Mastomys natalensis cytomegalovirus 3]